jgi:vacuolar protein sorting-associated protein 13A/C
MRPSKILTKVKAKRVWGEIDEVFKKFICPTFIDIRITLNNPNIQVKGWLQFD